MYIVPVHCTYSQCTALYLWNVPVPCRCTLYLYNVHVQCTCTMYLYNVIVQCTCTMYLYNVPVQCTCTMYLYNRLCWPKIWLHKPQTKKKTSKNPPQNAPTTYLKPYSKTTFHAYTSALGSTLKLRSVVYHVKNFRPGILVLSGSPTERPALTYLAANITKNVALMINAEICTNELKTKELEAQRITGEKWLESKNINSFVQVVNSKTVLQGVSSLMQVTGLGQLKPNTLFLGYKSDWLSCGIEDVRNYTAVIQGGFSKL